MSTSSTEKKRPPEIISIDSSTSDSDTTDGETAPALRRERRATKRRKIGVTGDTAHIEPIHSEGRSHDKSLHSPIHLNYIPALPESENADTLTLTDILRAGLVSTWQINFSIDVPFLVSRIHPSEREACDIHIVSAAGRDIEEQKVLCMNASRITSHNVDMEDRYGTHHSKMMINFFRNGSCQVVIHTANLIQVDWDEKSEAIWLSPILCKRDEASRPLTDAKGNTGLQFQTDLLEYLTSYRKASISPLLKDLSLYDFTTIRAIFIGSVPGAYPLSSSSFGLMKLRKCLREASFTPDANDVLVAQVSSLGSLGGPYYNEFQSVLASSCSTSTQTSSIPKTFPLQLLPIPAFKLIFPTVDNVRDSLSGWASGTSLFFNAVTAGGQRQLSACRPHLCCWSALNAGRARIMPHIKSYMRFSRGHSGTHPVKQQAQQGDTERKKDKIRVKWYLLTSANLSKSAWGAKESGSFKIRSYEAGVLILPQHFDRSFMTPSYKSDSEHSDGQLNIRLSYDLPPIPYAPHDQIWSANMATTQDIGRDWLGDSFVDTIRRLFS